VILLTADELRQVVAEAVEPLRRELVALRRERNDQAVTIAEAARRPWRGGSIRQAPSGVWEVRWQSGGRRKFRSGFKTREDAAAAADRLSRLRFQLPVSALAVDEAPWYPACEGCAWVPPNLPGFRGVMHSHHIVPRSAGGSDEPENLAVLCPTCHSIAHRGLYRSVERRLWPTGRESLVAGLEALYGMPVTV
jgi:hypothetical protein